MRKKGMHISTVVVTSWIKCYARDFRDFWFCSRVGVRITLFEQELLCAIINGMLK